MRSLRARSFVLLAVMVVITIGALVGTTLIHMAEAERSSARAAMRRAESRRAAWSLVQAVMESLGNERERLISGGECERPPPTEWPEGAATSTDGGEGVVARIVKVRGEPLRSEAGKIDLNVAPAAVLERVPGLNAEIAAAIVAARGTRPLSSVADLLEVPGVTPAMLMGEAESEGEPGDGAVVAAAIPSARSDAGSSVGAAVESAGPLSDVVTVFAFDPNVQCGVGDDGAEFDGLRRINLNVKWSDRLEKAVASRFGQPAADGLKQIMSRGTKFEKESDVVKVLRGLNVPQEDWGRILDAFTTREGPFAFGRVDVLRAPAEVLACIPGIDAGAAGQIVERRSLLADDSRRSLMWLVQESILTEEQFESAVDHLTNRSLLWSIVVEAGTPAPVLSGSVGRGGEAVGPLRDRVVIEAVIDVATDRPRIAYLRDVTLLDVARDAADREPEPEAAGEPEDRAEGAETRPDDTANGRSTAETSTPEDRPTLTERADRRREERERERESRRRTRTDESAKEEAGTPESEDGQESESDRRIGRWTVGPEKG